MTPRTPRTRDREQYPSTPTQTFLPVSLSFSPLCTPAPANAQVDTTQIDSLINTLQTFNESMQSLTSSLIQVDTYVQETANAAAVAATL
jgi:hypothetical protein